MSVFLAVLAIASATSQSAELTAFDGDWVYVEDLTPGKTFEQLGPPMSSKFSFKAKDGIMVLVSGHGSGHKDVNVMLDGTPLEIPGTTAGALARYKGAWKDGTLSYEVEFVRTQGAAPDFKIQREFKITKEGLQVRALTSSGGDPSIALYRHPQDIALPTPAKAAINDLNWLAGAWTGTRGTSGTTTIEERWSPPKGGSMLAVSRTVSRDRLSAFEFLRIVEREGGLVYIAQPNGAPPTEFILTEHSPTRAVFENPRHDYPKRITYELTAPNTLTATIGFLKGGTPTRFEYKREQ